MRLNWNRIFAVLLVVVLVGCGDGAEDAQEVVVASAKELKGIKAQKITWKKDSALQTAFPTAEVSIINKDNVGLSLSDPKVAVNAILKAQSHLKDFKKALELGDGTESVEKKAHSK